MRNPRMLISAAIVALVFPTVLLASSHGPKPVWPKNGASIRAGNPPAFQARTSAAGTVWLHLSKSSRKQADGVIRNDVLTAQMKRRKGTLFQHKPKDYTFASYWANRPGRYYWQTFYIQCGVEPGSDDCKVEGRLRSFRIR